MEKEWKIGEIRQVNGEWYQCVVAMQGCRECSFHTQDFCTRHSECMSTERSDKTSVIFKKLEKVGEPYYNSEKKLCQQYKCYIEPLVTDEIVYVFADNRAVIEIKQTKEDMEENKLNLKPFDIQKAKDGKPVCTRDGRKARIICFDKQEGLPIVALVERNKNGRISEEIALFYINGRAISADIDSKDDLMMLPEKKSGWINVKKDAGLFKSREEAERNCTEGYAPVMVEFEI